MPLVVVVVVVVVGDPVSRMYFGDCLVFTCMPGELLWASVGVSLVLAWCVPCFSVTPVKRC